MDTIIAGDADAKMVLQHLESTIIFYHNNCHDGEAAAAQFSIANHNCICVGIPPGASSDSLNQCRIKQINSPDRFVQAIFVDVVPKTDAIINFVTSAEISRVVVIDHHVANYALMPEIEQAVIKTGATFVNILSEDNAMCAAMLVATKIFNVRDNELPLMLKFIDAKDRFAFNEIFTSDRCMTFASMHARITPTNYTKYAAMSPSELLCVIDERLVADQRVKGPIIEAIFNNLARQAVTMLDESTNPRSIIGTFECLRGTVPPHLIADLILYGSKHLEIIPESVQCYLLYWQDKDGSVRNALRRVRPDGFDIFAIAKHFGGNGHPNACGFPGTKYFENVETYV